MATTTEERVHVFIVRIWSPSHAADGPLPPLRGVVEDARTGDQRVLRGLDDVLAFIRHRVGDIVGARRRRRCPRFARWLRRHW